jgi:DNA polymerase
MTTLWFDCETFSEEDLFAAGTHAYAEHPSTEIIIAQWAIDDGEPVVLDVTALDGFYRSNPMQPLFNLLEDPTVTVVAHNSPFDRALIRHCWGIDISPERWLDTMVQALAHGLPGGLDKVGVIMGVEADEQKDKRGKELIRRFCKPQPRTHERCTRHTHPQEWAEFLEYSRQDIVAMRAIHKALPKWNYRPGHPELALWHLDQRINDRGFAVDLDLARATIDAVAEEQVRLKQETHDLTDGEVSSPSKRDALLVHILMEYGVTLPDMRADTLRRRMEDPELPEGVKLLLAIRLEATKTSTAKYKTAVRAASTDGRLRNTQQFCGAQRTGRVAHRLFQPGNMPRPDMELIEREMGVSFKGLDDEQVEEIATTYYDLGVEALKRGVATHYFVDVMGLSANLVRGTIIAPPERKLCIADLANIEGRGLAYLAGEQWKLQAFRAYDAGTGPDLYKVAYARSFSIDPKDAVGQKRQIGKVMELGLGYEGGVAAFLTFAAVYKMDLGKLADAVHTTAPKDALAAAYGVWEWAEKKRRTLGLERNVYVACEVLKRAWRDAHPETVSLWSELADAVRSAVLHPGVCVTVRQLKVQRDGAWLRIRLPSGRCLCYIKPEVGEDGQITYWGVNQYTKQWARIKTYGGKLVENIVQAWARDVLFYSAPRAEAIGYEIVLSVHDEFVTETPDKPQYSSDELAAIISTPHAWAADCPLAAAGFETHRYRK